MKREEEYLIEFIRCALGSKELPEHLCNLSLEERRKILFYAQKQALLPFLQYFEVFLQEDCHDLFFKSLLSYIYRDSRQESEKENLLDAFEENGIYCIPLKGIVTKEWYPTSELRSMGDLDLLYQAKQTKEVKALMKNLGYEYEGEAAKHDHYKKLGTTVEMHKELVAASSVAYEYYQNIWERAKPKAGKNFIWELSLEEHYIFTFCHLMEHFIRGGIGVRMVLDIYVLSRLPQMDWGYIEKQLKILGVTEFERNIRRLSELWFSEDVNSSGEIEREKRQYAELAEYIADGGVFGNRKNESENQVIAYHSKKNYFVQVVFPSYRVMRSVFPWLMTPLLLPAAWVVRGWNVWSKRRRNIELQMERMIEMGSEGDKGVESRKKFFQKYGLFFR